ncbi:hypothetical protein AVEN_19854-1 [Araneus ventricosus]|uniref:Uncharacterized protein n=1 Tax=Araneus ventricosus TaxID=182803 RepID=A0A4Y2X576_ARAVE|nr:hypothetical protein AVEN_19854-1 [Araneus ventricosus]
MSPPVPCYFTILPQDYRKKNVTVYHSNPFHLYGINIRLVPFCKPRCRNRICCLRNTRDSFPVPEGGREEWILESARDAAIHEGPRPNRDCWSGEKELP